MPLIKKNDLFISLFLFQMLKVYKKVINLVIRFHVKYSN